MTTKEEILKLAESSGFGSYAYEAGNIFEAFYHAARKPLESQLEDAKCGLKRFYDTTQELRQQLAEKDAEIESLIGKNQNLFNALMASTQKKDNLYQSIRSASGHLNLYGLFSCVEGDSYDPECADKNVRKANSILKAELTTEIIKPAGKEDQAVCNSILKEQYK